MKGTELKKRLRRTGRTMKEIGELIGMSSQSLNQLFGAQDVKSGVLEQLAAALGMSIAELYDCHIYRARPAKGGCSKQARD